MKSHQTTAGVAAFADLALHPILVTALTKQELTKPTSVQAQAIPLAMAGADYIAVAQTGSGKTLAYALPLVNLLLKKESARGLILAPSREMAQQIFRVITQLTEEAPITATLVVGGLPSDRQKNQMNKHPKLIVATPGRLNDLLAKNKLLLQNVEMIVIDEADRMLDMGFAPQLQIIRATLRGTRQTLMFSATFNDAVDAVTRSFLRPGAVMVRSGITEAPVSTLRQKVLLIERDHKNDRLLDELNKTTGGVIVFTADKERCEAVGKLLREYGYASDLIHGDMSAGQRNRVIREFRAGELRIVVATDLLARGLDVPHVDHVINFDFPFDPGDFLHRIGRTARAGRVGYAITFVTPSDERRYDKAQPFLKNAEVITVDRTFAFTHGERQDRYASKSKRPAARPALKTRAAAGERPPRAFTTRGAAGDSSPRAADRAQGPAPVRSRSTGDSRPSVGSRPSFGPRAAEGSRPGGAPRSADGPRAFGGPRTNAGPRPTSGPRATAGPRSTAGPRPTSAPRGGGPSRSAGGPGRGPAMVGRPGARVLKSAATSGGGHGESRPRRPFSR